MNVEWHEMRDSEKAASQGAAFQQSMVYARAVMRVGGLVLRAVVRDGVDVIATAQVLRRPGVRVVLRGPVWAEGTGERDRHHALRRLARQGAAVLVTPEAPMAGFGLVPLISARFCALWSLAPDEASLRAQAGAKWRNRMLATAREGVDVRPGDIRDLEPLIMAEGAQRRQRNYHALPPAFTRALDPGALRLWHWRERGRLHAAMCFVRHGTWATYHMGWADEAARTVGAHGLMLWQAAMSLRAEGVSTLDLGDINTEAAPGLARFKLGTGARLHRLGATCLVLPG